MRDSPYPSELMPATTDEEFIEMVKVAQSEGRFNTDWMPRMLEIATKVLDQKFQKQPR